ncbi:zinc ribbon domain-containing protein [Paenibacillus elgii]|uniref:zinc ribbon domain-containing protein n=1 Tax=Paenibacillus elgii TaxID=189691 RepID=UPI0013D76178|nr:zinc ribbon domain-containing protein [Paenibacillus elgii]
MRYNYRKITKRGKCSHVASSMAAKNYPSSQLCHVCQSRNPEVKNLNMRSWTCSGCGTYHERDHNASMNILQESPTSAPLAQVVGVFKQSYWCQKG